MNSAAGVGENEPAVLGLRADSTELLYRWYRLQGLPALPFLPAFAVKNLSFSTRCSLCCLVSGCCIPSPFPVPGFLYLQGGEAVVLQERQACDRDQQELKAKGVILTVKCSSELHVDHVHGDVGTYQKNDLGEGGETARPYLPLHLLCLRRGQLCQNQDLLTQFWWGHAREG